ncbi:MAG: dicarboxylate/amino acid:cation symporter [Negativicutes bacterium]|nr:dicarboxylate/amino acid:cation symporter [Negativicutes bacterium]
MVLDGDHSTGSTGFMKSTPLWVQILVGLILGIVVGFAWPEIANTPGMLAVGTAFIKAIKMIVIPLVFSAVTLGIYTMGSDLRQLGRLGVIAFIWFYVATGISIVIGISLNEIFHPAAGVVLAKTGSIPQNLSTSVNWINFFLDIIPDNSVFAMANQKIVPTLFFAICFGLSLAKAGEAAKPVVKFFEGVLSAMFKMTQGVISVAPVAVAAIIAWVIASQGTKLLIAMAKLVGTLYIGLFIVAAIFLVIVKALGYPPIDTIKKIMEPLLLAFTTASSEVTLPVHMRILESTGIPRKVVSFVLPLGYSFNLDGAALYQALATCFLAEAYGIELTLPSLITILITTLIANKGTANVPGASLVVLAVLLTSLGLPVEAIAIIAGVDRFGDMGRTTINVFGNTVATLALFKFGGKAIQDAVAAEAAGV